MFESAEVGHKLDKAELRQGGAEAAGGAARRAVRPLRARALPDHRAPLRHRRRRAERDRQPAERVDGPAPHLHPRVRPPQRRGARAAAGVALLARAAAEGQDGLFLNSWYTSCSRSGLRADRRRRPRPPLEEIRRFERMLADEGVLILKFWFHLSKRRAAAAPEGPGERPADALAGDRRGLAQLQDLRPLPRGRRARRCARRAPREAPWMVVEGGRCPLPRPSPSARILLEAMRAPPGRAARAGRPVPTPRRSSPPVDNVTAPARLDLSQKLDEGLSEAAREASRSASPSSRATRSSRALDGGRLRGHGRGRQGRRDPPRHGRPRRAPVPRRPRRGADRRGARAALPVALLAPRCRGTGASRSSTAPGTAACWSSASRASAPTPTGCAPTREINDFEEQLVRGGTIVVQVLAADQPGGAAAALQGAREDRASSASRSPTKTGATARSGTPTSRRSAT